MIEVGLGLIQVSVTLLASWAAAHIVFGRLWRFEHWALRSACYAGIGLIFWSHVLFLLTVAHLIEGKFLLALFVAMACIGVAGLWLYARDADLKWSNLRTAVREKVRDRATLAFLVGAALYAVWLGILAALPSTAVDELVYHLEVPRQMLAAGGHLFFADNVFAYFPLFGEMFFLFALPISGEPGAHLFHVAFVALNGLAVYGFLRPQVGRHYALLGVAALWSIPTVVVVGTWAYVDLTFAFYSLLALFALQRYSESGERQWVLLASLAAGGALCVKYTGLQLSLLLALVLLIEHLRKRKGTLPVAAGSLILGALLVASPYLVRNWLFTGWPLFPFKAGFFPLSPLVNWDTDRAGLLLRFLATFGTGDEGILTGVVLAPIRVFVSGRFYDLRLYDGIAGPVFLLVPFLAWKLRREWAMNFFGVFVLLFIGYWTITTQQVRFLLPAIAVMCILLAYGVARLRHPLLQALVGILLAVNLGLALNETLGKRPWGVLSGQESVDEYRLRRVPLYPMYQFLNRRLTDDDRVFMVGASNLCYYLQRPWRSDYVFETYRVTKVLEKASDPAELLTFLKEQQVNHLLLNEYVLTHPQAGLPPRELSLLREFVARYTRPAGQTDKFVLLRLVPDR